MVGRREPHVVLALAGSRGWCSFSDSAPPRVCGGSCAGGFTYGSSSTDSLMVRAWDGVLFFFCPPAPWASTCVSLPQWLLFLMWKAGLVSFQQQLLPPRPYPCRKCSPGPDLAASTLCQPTQRVARALYLWVSEGLYWLTHTLPLAIGIKLESCHLPCGTSSSLRAASKEGCQPAGGPGTSALLWKL